MRVLVLGIGNVIYADEGIGVHFVRALAQNYKFYPKAAARNSMAGEDFAAQNFKIIEFSGYKMHRKNCAKIRENFR